MLRNKKDRMMFAIYKRYSSLNKTEKKIFEYLYSIKQFNGGYADLARQLGYGTATRTVVMDNLKSLEKKGFVTITTHTSRKKVNKIMDSCKVKKNWWKNEREEPNNGN